MNDMVNHPKHYSIHTVYVSGIRYEPIDIIEDLSFNKGCILKYTLRAKYKGNEIQDLEKAVFYINRCLDKSDTVAFLFKFEIKAIVEEMFKDEIFKDTIQEVSCDQLYFKLDVLKMNITKRIEELKQCKD